VRLWKVVVLLNLALGVGVGLGALHGARELRRLRDEIARVRAELEAERAARSTWSARGIVRAVLPPQGVVVLTHEALPGLMSAMTMPFQVDDAALLDGLEPGDAVRFSVRKDGDRLVLASIEKAAR
jgi:Cu/Ag efflux protein CusF